MAEKGISQCENTMCSKLRVLGSRNVKNIFFKSTYIKSEMVKKVIY